MKRRPAASTCVDLQSFGKKKVVAASQSTKRLGAGVRLDESYANILCHQEIHDRATQAFLKPFRMRVYVFVLGFFLTFVKEICSFAGYSLGEFRVRWSRFDAITGRRCQVVIIYDEFRNQNRSKQHFFPNPVNNMNLISTR